MKEEEEEEEEELSFFHEDKKMINTINYSISEIINDNISTYTGVKSINEETQSNATNTDIKNNQIKSNHHQNKNKIKTIKKKKKKEMCPSMSQKNYPSLIKRKSFKDYFPKEKKEKNEKNENEKEEKEKNEKENEKEEKKEKKKKKKKIKKNSEKNSITEVETQFEWDEGGELVFLTGSFCDWKEFYKMIKDDEGIFRISILLPKGFHQYKFIVDEKWEYSKKQPKFEDNGNINNYIDTTDNEYENENENENKREKKKERQSKSKSKSKKKSKNKEKLKKKKNKKRFSVIQTINFLNSQNNYTTYYPLKSELNKKPLSLPGLYKTLFILNEDCNTKKERRYSHIELNNKINKSYKSNKSSRASSRCNSNISLSDNSSEISSHSKLSIFGEIIPYVKFQNLYHIHSNHLHSKIIKYSDRTVNSITLRYRFKLSTFIYYKPCKIEEKKRQIKHSKTSKNITLKFRKK